MMHIEVQAHDDGSLRFVAPERGTVATLSAAEVAVLYSLRMASTRSTPRRDVFFALHDHPRVAGPVAAHMQRLKTVEPYGPLGFWAEMGHLQALDLVAPYRRNPLLELARMAPHAAFHLTKQGEVLVDWLISKWAGWAAYSQRFRL